MEKVELLKKGAMEYGIDLTDTMVDQFLKYAELLKEWNEKINLTAIVDDEGIVKKHFLDSISPISTGYVKEGMSLIDVGTGAGFPGLPLKIVMPELKVVLLDSLQKRVNFLNEVIEKLGLKGIEAVHMRSEDAGQNKNYREKFDISTARAVAAMPVLSEYCLPFVKKGGHFIALKGPSAQEEMDSSKNAIATLGGNFVELIDVNILEEEMEHKIIVVNKVKATDMKYPRKSGKISKNPIM